MRQRHQSISLTPFWCQLLDLLGYEHWIRSYFTFSQPPLHPFLQSLELGNEDPSIHSCLGLINKDSVILETFQICSIWVKKEQKKLPEIFHSCQLSISTQSNLLRQASSLLLTAFLDFAETDLPLFFLCLVIQLGMFFRNRKKINNSRAVFIDYEFKLWSAATSTSLIKPAHRNDIFVYH